MSLSLGCNCKRASCQQCSDMLLSMRLLVCCDVHCSCFCVCLQFHPHLEGLSVSKQKAALVRAEA